MVKGHRSLPATSDTIMNRSSAVDGTSMHTGESSTSARDQYALSIAKYVVKFGKEGFGPCNWAIWVHFSLESSVHQGKWNLEEMEDSQCR